MRSKLVTQLLLKTDVGSALAKLGKKASVDAVAAGEGIETMDVADSRIDIINT
jgi:hypothetical protein